MKTMIMLELLRVRLIRIVPNDFVHRQFHAECENGKKKRKQKRETDKRECEKREREKKKTKEIGMRDGWLNDEEK